LRDALGSSAFTSGHHIRRLAPALAAALAAGTYLIIAPPGADLPAQLLRVRLFAVQGFGLWNNWWYGGHDLLGYSVLFPPLGWLLGPRLLASLASVGTAAACAALARDHFGERAWIGATWLGAATVTQLLSGRLTFALGLCGAAVTALVLERRREDRLAVAALSGVTALASPVAGLLVILAGAVAVARALAGSAEAVESPAGSATADKSPAGSAAPSSGPKRRNWTDIAGGIAAISVQILLLGALALAFPTGGHQPFATTTLWPLLVAGGFVVALRPGAAITTATLLYLAGCLAAYAIPSPIGANAARLGDLLAGPLVALVLVPRRAWLLLGLAAMPLSYLQLHAAVSDLARGATGSSASYYAPLVRFLRAQPGAAEHRWRVEVPSTAGHWESYWLAPELPLARGWERQTDIADNTLFYAQRLTGARYRAWLHGLAVRYVAVAGAPADYSARAELRLIGGGLPYLRVVRRLPHWTVYSVSDPAPLASGVGRVLTMGASSLRLAVSRPGSIYLRVHWSPYWRLRGLAGCVAPAGSFTRVAARAAGRAQLVMSFGLSRIGSRAPRCG